MAGVTINTGPITATRRARDIPKEKWNLLIGARQSFVKVHIPADCRQLFDFIEEARDERMWECTGHLDPATGEWRAYTDLNDLIETGLGIDPDLANWAIEGLKALSPEEMERAITLNQAVAGGIAKSRKEKAEQTRRAVEAAITANPEATQEQIAEVAGVTQQRVSQITNEIQANSTPILLNHGSNQHIGHDNNNVLTKQGTSKDYILARLQRDGHGELAEQVKSGEVSARKAGLQVGYVKPVSELTALKRHWKKASEDERQDFLRWLTNEC